MANARGIERRFGIAMELDEKHCDSLEDFLLNKIGPGDVVLADEPCWACPASTCVGSAECGTFRPRSWSPRRWRSPTVRATRQRGFSATSCARRARGLLKRVRATLAVQRGSPDGTERPWRVSGAVPRIGERAPIGHQGQIGSEGVILY